MASAASPILEEVHRLVDPLDHVPDRVLLSQYLAGEQDAFARLVARHGPMVFGICRRALRAAQADDAFQAVLLALIHRARALATSDSIAGWLHVVARNAVRRIIRDESRTRGGRAIES